MIRRLLFPAVAALCIACCSLAAAAADLQPVQFLGMHSQLPAAWTLETPSSSMRLVQAAVPAVEGGEGAHFVIYYFGPGQGGSVEANVQRWVSQFSAPDGKPVKPQVTQIDSGRMPSTLVQLQGSYARGIGMGPKGTALPDQMLLAAVVETPQGNLYAQLYGPAPLVAQQRQALIVFLEGIAADAAR